MKFLNKLSISQKINFSFYVSFAVMAILIALPFTFIETLNTTYQKDTLAYTKTQNFIHTIHKNLQNITTVGIENALNNTTSSQLQINKDFSTIQEQLKHLQESQLIQNNEELKEIMLNIQKRVVGYKHIAFSIKDEMKEDYEDGVYAILALLQTSKKISQEFEILLEELKSIHTQHTNQLQTEIRDSIYSKIIITIFILLILLLLNKKVVANILYELRKLHQLINSFFDVLNRKRTKALHITIDSDDEIGKMAHLIDKNIYVAEQLLESERNRTRDIEIQVDIATKEIKKLNKELHATQKEIIYVMGTIAEEHSKETGLHIKRVASYSFLLAKLAGLDLKEAILLRDVSPMHDIGKLGIPDAILNKPGRFTDEEFSIMKKHTTIGYNMLSHSKRKLLKTAAIVAYEHHERWDGTGYPRKLKGEEIHIYGRITAIVDVFDALASDRVYKKAWPLEKILKLLKEEKGKQFDPQLIQLFLDNIDRFLQSKKYIEKRES
jgi:response regulator RpfG family c-di-GMP phosphodiesterase